MNFTNILVISTLLIVNIFASDCNERFIKIGDKCYYEKHISLLKDFINTNESLYGKNPLDIGYQEWKNNKLIHLYLSNIEINILPGNIGENKDIKSIDLSNNNISFIYENICDIYPYYTEINLSNNKICPPYPYCFEYIDNQKNDDCLDFKCNDNYVNISDNCYHKKHIKVLEDFIKLNESLNETFPLEIGSEIGFQKWNAGKLTHLNLINNNLTKIPESICSIYSELEFFNISNNNICPPYPSCFEFIGFQNTSICNEKIVDEIYEPYIEKNANNQKLNNDEDALDSLKIEEWQALCPKNYVKYDNKCYFQAHINILQDFLDVNKNLNQDNPLEIGKQSWKNNKLINLNLSDLEIVIVPDSIGLLENINSLDLSNNNISSIPEGICKLYNSKALLNVSNNKICSSYPSCLEYISEQVCEKTSCPDGFEKINNDCIFINDLNFLSSIVDSNYVLQNIFGNSDVSEIYNQIGYQIWKNGKLDTLVIQGFGLTNIPENICQINERLYFNADYNSICAPYPSCYVSFQNQNLSDCNIINLPQLHCPDSCISYYNNCYDKNDLIILNDFIKNNESLTNYHPLSIGIQIWNKNKLEKINLNSMSITTVPQSIYKLSHLNNLNLSNNYLENLPETFCLLYPKLESLNLNSNNICEPFIDCFDFIGGQRSEICSENKSCSFGYIEINESCYYKKDIEILNQFIKLNTSLKSKNPLEIGLQKWNNMQLEYLYLGENELTKVPDDICFILPQLKGFNISQNKICSLYPACIEEYMGEQDKSNCNK